MSGKRATFPYFPGETVDPQGCSVRWGHSNEQVQVVLTSWEGTKCPRGSTMKHSHKGEVSGLGAGGGAALGKGCAQASLWSE